MTDRTWRTLIALAVVIGLLMPPNSAEASNARMQQDAGQTLNSILSDGQFVYGPNVTDFSLDDYLGKNASHLLPYRDAIFFYSAYPSINPRMLLTLLELRGQLISTPPGDQGGYANPLQLPVTGFEEQLEYITGRLTQAYYHHLRENSKLKPSEGAFQVTLKDGKILDLAARTNAATFAMVSALGPQMDEVEARGFLDADGPDGFYRTYLRLFPGNDPLDESNKVDIALAPPSDMFQFPFPVGESWSFNGVHHWNGSTGGDMSSIDFSNGWPNWGADTNNQWVVAAAGGTVQKISNCWVEVTHSDGWKTRYYHLENVQMSSGTVSRNDRLANVANTLAEATCNGGSGTGPHVHFTLIHNGALTTLDGTVLSGWKIDSGRWAYDSDCNYMFLQKGSDKKCSYSYVRNDGAGSSPPPCPSSGGVILYKHANYDCGGEGEGSGYVIRTGTGWQNVPGSFNDQASSIRVPSGWSVKLFEHADRGGGCACRNGDDDNFWGDYLNNGVGLNDNVSSFEVFNTPNCGENHPPNTPSPQSPSDGHVAYDGRAPTLCWSKPNDPDGDQLWFYAEVYGSAVNDNSGWFRPSSDPPCWRPTKLDGQYYNYQWHVKASDLKPNGESDWSDPWHFTIERPNNPPSISFNTANGNSFPSGRIETRDRTWTFQGTAADSDGSVSRVEFRCDSCDNRGSGPDQATGTTSWSLTRNNMAGQNDVYFMVYDNQGASTASHHLDLNIDLAAPQTTVALNSERNPNRWPEWFTVPVVVSLQAQDSSTGRANVGVQEIRYRLDGGAWQTRSGADTSFTVSSDGTHTVEYYAVDRVGNAEGQRSVTFKIDRTPPTAPGAATETHGVISSQWQKDWDNPAFTWGAATDATSGVRYYWLDWKDERSGVYTPAFDPQAVRTGSYELRVWAVDYAGNVGLEGAFFTFRYDGTPPPAPAIQNNDASVSSGIWQNTVRTANFSWPAVQDEGSGVAGYNVYWGPDPDGTSGILQTGATYVNATPICAVNEAATYYLRARSQDNVDWPSEWVAYALRYDGAPPTADLVANYGLDVAHQTNVHLNIDADDVGSGVTQMRLSNDARAWSDWADVTTEIYWGIPDVGRRWNPIYLQVLDGAGNVSMVVSDTVYLDVNVPHPQSESYWLWDGAVPAGGAVVTSTNYNLRASVGQSLDSSPVTSANYRLRGGFQAGALAAPTETPTYTTYSQLGYVIAGGGACTPTLQSANYWMYGTLGQPAHVCTVTSTNYLLWSGFWGGAGTDLGAPPPPPPPPSPPTPACEFYRLSINNGAPFTNRPAITLNLCGPDAVEMMLSNDEGFSGATWQPYTQAISWTLATSGAYVLPRFVYAQFRDSVGAIHGIFFDDIIYDPSAPDGQASFDVVNLLPGTQLRSESRPLQVVSKDTTDLFLSANDDSSGLAWIQVSEYLTLTKATWQPYSAIVPITLTGDDGVKTLYVHFRDQAGNVSAPASTSFILDTEPPFGGIAIGQQIVGPAVITSTVYLGAEDNLSGVGDMRVSDEASFTHAPWQAYTNTLTWPISMTTPGTLYVQYRDLAGNISAVYSDTYLVDTVPPVLYVEIAPGDTLTRSVTILSYDALVSLGQMWLSNDPLMLDGVVSLPYTSTVTWAFDERRVIWVRLADSVGNVTEPYPAYAGGAIEYKLYLPLVMKSH